MRSIGVLAVSISFLGCGSTVVVDGPGNGGGEPAGGAAGVECDAHEDCRDFQLCVFATGTCETACESMTPMICAEKACDSCGTSSCPGCEDCRAVCLPQP